MVWNLLFFDGETPSADLDSLNAVSCLLELLLMSELCSLPNSFSALVNFRLLSVSDDLVEHLLNFTNLFSPFFFEGGGFKRSPALV